MKTTIQDDWNTHAEEELLQKLYFWGWDKKAKLGYTLDKAKHTLSLPFKTMDDVVRIVAIIKELGHKKVVFSTDESNILYVKFNIIRGHISFKGKWVKEDGKWVRYIGKDKLILDQYMDRGKGDFTGWMFTHWHYAPDCIGVFYKTLEIAKRKIIPAYCLAIRRKQTAHDKKMREDKQRRDKHERELELIRSGKAE